jgi:penicillin-binding protein 1C
LRHLRQDIPKTVAATAQAPLKIAFPLDGARVELGFTRATDLHGTLVLKASGGVLPLTWMVNGAPVSEAALRRQSTWTPDGAGFARVSVIDAQGTTDSVLVRIE